VGLKKKSSSTYTFFLNMDALELEERLKDLSIILDLPEMHQARPSGAHHHTSIQPEIWIRWICRPKKNVNLASRRFK
jgi:hypothetical protein